MSFACCLSTRALGSKKSASFLSCYVCLVPDESTVGKLTGNGTGDPSLPPPAEVGPVGGFLTFCVGQQTELRLEKKKPPRNFSRCRIHC